MPINYILFDKIKMVWNKDELIETKRGFDTKRGWLILVIQNKL